MKKISFLVICSAWTLISISQPFQQRMAPPPTFQRNQQKLGEAMMMQRLNLTQSQREQLKKEHDKALEKILTADQKGKLAQFRKQQEAWKDSAQKRQDRQLKAKLGLSDEQVVKLRDQQKQFKDKMRAIREDVNQTVQQQRDRTRELWQAQQKAWKELLSPEQQQKFRALMQQKLRGQQPQRKQGMQPMGFGQTGNRAMNNPRMGNCPHCNRPMENRMMNDRGPQQPPLDKRPMENRTMDTRRAPRI